MCLASELFNRTSGTTDHPMPTTFGSLELDWFSLVPFSFFLFPEPLLGLRSTGIVKGKALIRDKESTKDSPFPKNTIVSVVARLPTSLRRGLEKAAGSNMVFIKYYGRSHYKGAGMGPLLCRFFVQAVSEKREHEILEACRIPRNKWP